MKTYKMNKAALNFIRAALIIVALVIIYLSFVYLSDYPIIMWLVIGLAAAVTILYTCVFLPIYFKSSRYTIGPEDIRKQAGMFFFSKQYMKLESIQYVSSIISPLSQFTGLNFVTINAFGGRIVFMFLTRNDALEIINYLEDYIKKRDGIE
ncbi:MAG: hypothetical protein LIO41_00165 [Ruminococcus sp.]|nr:hypothetical protein [Ruminococcus sp.]